MGCSAERHRAATSEGGSYWVEAEAAEQAGLGRCWGAVAEESDGQGIQVALYQCPGPLVSNVIEVRITYYNITIAWRSVHGVRHSVER